MTLHAWAARWNISPNAVADLQREFGMDGDPFEHPSPAMMRQEGQAQALIRLEAARKGLLIWRNNVGALADKDGRFVRYGLANDSASVNARIKSGDLIGVRPVLVQQRHLGTTIGQFVSREVKAPGWHYSATPREVAQLRWIELVASVGGDAKFATGEGTL